MNNLKNHDSIREYVHAVNKQGLVPLIESIIKKSRELLSGADRGEEILRQLHELFDQASAGDDLEVSRARLSGMLRYLLEDGDYHVDEPVQLQHLIEEQVLRPGAALIDLGAGSAEAVKLWARQGNPAVGIDASPSFVADSELLRLGLIDADVGTLSAVVSHLSRNRVVMTSLTLDRVAKPKQLAKNLVELAGEEGNFMLASLFPVVPHDDEKVSHPITYTPHSHRITTTGTEEGDLAAVKEFLEDYSHRKVMTKQLPYAVTTHSGKQVYKNYHALWTADTKHI